jgi:hypothetical protein
MEQKKFSVLLKVIITGAVICCVLVYALIVPEVGKSLVEAGGEEFAPYYLPWYLFVLGTALPIAAAAVLAWLIAVNIGRNRSFSRENAKYLSVIAILAAADAAYFFIGNLVLLFLGMNHPGLLLASLLPVFAGAAIAVVAAALSHYALKGAKLQEENDLTI